MGLAELEARSLNGGLVTGIPAFQVGAAESPDCQNIDPSHPFGAATRPGSSLYQSAASAGSGARVTGLFPWFRGAGTQYTMFAFATTIYAADGASSLAIKTGMATDSIMQAAPLNNMLVVVASGLFPQISSSGSTLASITSGTYLPTLAKYATGYASRVWLAGHPTTPNTIFSCATNDPEAWGTANNAGSIVVGGGDGDTIRGINGCKRIMYIFKRNQTYALIGDSPFNYEVHRLQQRGVVSEYAHASDGEGCFFASNDGIFYATGMNVAKVSEAVRQTYQNISDKTTIALEVKGSKLFVFYAASGTENNAALVLDFTRKMPTGEVRGIWSQYSSQPYQVAKLGRDNNLYAGTNASTVQLYQLDTGTSGAVACYWNSPDLDYGNPHAIKKLARFYIHVSPPTATTTLTAQWFAEGSSIGSSYSMSVGTVGSYSVVQWPMIALSSVRGNYLRLKLSWTGNMTIYGFKTYADVCAEGDMPRMGA